MANFDVSLTLNKSLKIVGFLLFRKVGRRSGKRLDGFRKIDSGRYRRRR